MRELNPDISDVNTIISNERLYIRSIIFLLTSNFSLRSFRFLKTPFQISLASASELLQLSFCYRCCFFVFFQVFKHCENLTRILAHDCPMARVLLIGALADSPRGCEQITRRDFCGKTSLDSTLARWIDDDSLYLRFNTRHRLSHRLYTYNARE